MRGKRGALVLATVVGAAALALGSPAAGSGGGTPKKDPVRIETHGVLTGPGSTAGTFVISGTVSDSGSYTDTFRLVGDTIHVVKTLSGSRGTITLTAKGVVRPTSPTTATFADGRWRVTSGTGAYVDLQGHGEPGAVGSVDFAAGTVSVVHVGKARL